MDARRPTMAAAAALAAAALAASALAPPPAGAAAAPSAPPSAMLVMPAMPAAAAPSASGDGSQHVVSPEQARRLGRPSGVPAGAPAADVARAFATQNARALGVRGDLVNPRAHSTRAGTQVVRFDQAFGGVPVVGGQVVVEVGPAGQPRGALSETLTSGVPGLTPSLTSREAVDLAVRSVARGESVPARQLRASEAVLSIYEPALLGAPGIGATRLVWRVEITSPQRRSIDQFVLVDAQRPVIALSFSQIDHAVERRVCDAANVAGAELPCQPADYEVLPSAQLDVQNAYDYAGATAAFYASVLGRDSIDGAGMALISTVRYCEPGYACPYANAFWDGSQMVYGAGYASADDVVAHELTHGVTERMNGLFYFFQSGAINESLSDIFGELVDLQDGVGNDAAEVRWQLGEDLPAAVGVVRDMADPTRFGDPDSTSSPLYSTGLHPDGYVYDGGGVHSNSGVGNKFASLLTDGGTFGGQTVAGVGETTTARVVYQAMGLLTSAADYRQFAAALRQGCATLGTAALVTADDCVQVDKAVLAVAMDATPVKAPLPAAPAACPDPSAKAVQTWGESFETDPASRWSRDASPWWYWSGGTNPYGWDNHYATDGEQNMWGDDPDTFGIAQLVMPLVPILPSSYLLLDHAWSFDTYRGTHYDGGRIDVMVEGAGTADGGQLMPAGSNGYNGSLVGSGTPFSGLPAFVGTSRGYVTSRLDVGSTGGSKVQAVLSIGADSAIADYGWFVDAVRVGYCDLTAPTAAVSVPAVSLSAPRFALKASDDGYVAHQGVQRRAAGARTALPSTWGAASTLPATATSTTAAFAAGTTSCVRVVAVDRAGRVSPAVARCTSMPLDDRSLARAGTWSSVSSTSAYRGTLSRSSRVGSTLTYTGVRGAGLSLVIHARPGGGKVGVYVGSRRVALISTAAATSVMKKVVVIATAALDGATVRLKVESAGTSGVSVDGLAVHK